MSSRLPRVSGKETVAALLKAGYTLTHVRGSHHYLEGPKGNIVTIPIHSGKVLKPGTPKTILAQAGLTVEGFKELL